MRVRLQGRKSSQLSRLQPTFCPKACPWGLLKTTSFTPQPCGPVQPSAFLGEPCSPYPTPPNTPPGNIHPPPLIAANSCDSERESFPRKPKKKIFFPGVRGNFNRKASGSRGALMAPRTQLGAPSIVNTILRGRDINRTYVQGHEEGDECFPKVEIKVINNVLLLLFSHRTLPA